MACAAPTDSWGSADNRSQVPPPGHAIRASVLLIDHRLIACARRRRSPRRASPVGPDRAASEQGGSAMDETMARAMIKDHFDASNVSVAGGGPGDDMARASEIYADDAVLEWPQGGERIRGKANII